MKRTHISIPEPSSRFNKVDCNECGERQVVYSHATTTTTCNSCGNVISEPTGSRADIKGTVSGNA